MVRPKKKFGQHFLKDENIARKIIECLPPDAGNVLEIGAGTGVLTKYLLANEKLNPFFFEIDNEAADYLEKTYPVIKERLLRKDFLEYDLSKMPFPFTIIGNFPYNISSQILFRVLEYRDKIPEVIGMFQKEVAERISSPPGSKKYGILSVLMQAYYSAEYLFTVSETVFFPPPKVKSAVVRFKRNSTGHLDCNEELFFVVVKTAFNQRRKTLRNALKIFTFEDEPGIRHILNLRAEQLNVNDFVFLVNKIIEGQE